VINMVAPTILLQLTLAASRYSPDTLKEDNYALGYIFGYHDAVLQALKVDDHSSIFTIMAASYNNIFSDQTVAAQLLRKSLESQHDATFMNGAIKGGGDAISSVREKQIQMGLFTWLTR
jgi:hypothetical protein